MWLNKDESGATAAEYTLMMTLIVSVILVLLQQVGDAINQVFAYVVNFVSSALSLG